MTGSCRWQLSATGELQWVQWGDECVLYHEGSGDTHLLEPFVMEVLQALHRAPATVSTIVEVLAREGGEETRHQMSNHIDSLFSTLHRLGVIEPA
jgi:PqqD family protein of HPr-rel-A system